MADMGAEAGLATVRQVVETRQLANGMFNGEPLARKADNLTMKSARTRRATLSLFKASAWSYIAASSYITASSIVTILRPARYPNSERSVTTHG